MPPYEGSGRVAWWIMALLASAFTVIIGAAMQDYFTQHRRIEERMDSLEREVICLRQAVERNSETLHLSDPHCAGMIR